MRTLLLGAGFTRNWGGWLATEFVGELCGRLADLPHLNEMLRVSQNFERVYGERLSVALSDPSNAQAQNDRTRLQQAINETFADMNNSVRLKGIDLAQTRDAYSTTRFLSRFDRIFTLNQDLFFEALYHGDHVKAESSGKWERFYLPNIPLRLQTSEPEYYDWQANINLPEKLSPDIASNSQPIYKLHGSVNWRDSSGSDVMVIGTGKENSIAASALLASYHQEFQQTMETSGNKVMVIGYSFSDPHINKCLIAGATFGLQMYLVNPAGLSCLKSGGLRKNGQWALSAIPLAGVSQRSLFETLSDVNGPSFKSFDRFLG